MATKQRILSVDVLRGLTIASMIIVNNPAVWGNQYAPLKHAPWHGLTPTDLVFPFFIFIMGVSAWFSLSRRAGENQGRTVWHVFKRSVMIYLVGAFLTFVSKWAGGNLNWESFRLMGVLQAISLTYLFGSLLLMVLKFKHLLVSAATILGAWWIVQLLGGGFDLSPDNIIAVVDRALLGEGHMYKEALLDGSGWIPFDPESLLTTIPRVGHFLLGAYVGKIMLCDSGRTDKLNGIFIFGAVILICGFLIQYGCPINKKIWTSSFALVTCGFASLLLGLFYWLIDIRGKKAWTGFFRVFGVNPLFLFALASLSSVALRTSITCGGESMSVRACMYYKFLCPAFGEQFGSLVYSLMLVAAIWLVGYILDRNKIYIKL